MKLAAILSIFVLPVIVGCTSTQPIYNGHGIVFYCDGAGVGFLITTSFPSPA